MDCVRRRVDHACVAVDDKLPASAVCGPHDRGLGDRVDVEEAPLAALVGEFARPRVVALVRVVYYEMRKRSDVREDAAAALAARRGEPEHDGDRVCVASAILVPRVARQPPTAGAANDVDDVARARRDAVQR